MDKLTGMTRADMLTALRIEERRITAERKALQHEISDRQQQIDQLDERLRDIAESYGLLG